MMRQDLIVHYADGTTKEVTATQWSLGRFAEYSGRKGIKVDLSNPGIAGLLMIRYQAFAELHRVKQNGQAQPSFDVWDATVDEVEPVEQETAVDPTPPGT